MREGDVFVVTKLDRLARSITDLMAILQALGRKGVAVRILNLTWAWTPKRPPAS
jgi:DNA invertase Pin-like site-specific DNA recombinase